MNFKTLQMMRNDNDEDKSSKVPFSSREVSYQCIADFIHWMLSSRFSSFALFSSFVFVSLTYLFALVIMALAAAEPKCVTSTVYETNSGFQAGFNDALSLSWTTFSTVGYGVISPSTSARFEEDEIDRFDRSGGCVLMSVALSFESLIGILFVSSAGALMYVKLIQFQSNAQVAFSNVLLVRYGKGVEAGDVNDDISVDSEQEEKDLQAVQKKSPFPILVFRMVNLLNSTKNGEIVDAHVNTMATVNLQNAVMCHITRGNTVFKNALNVDIKKKILGKRVYSYRVKKERPNSSERSISSFISKASSRRMRLGNNSNRSVSSHSTDYQPNKDFYGLGKSPSTSNRTIASISEDSSTENEIEVTESMRNSLKVKNVMFQFGMTQEQIDMTEKDVLDNVSEVDMSDDYGDFVDQTVGPYPPGLGKCVIHKEAQVEMPNMVFAKVAMDPVHHPYFRTSWRVLHTLDMNSPLLTKNVRNKIRDAGGSWPAALNTKEEIEKCIDFDQLLVSFRGLSKSTGTEVYSHHVYTKDDMKIGYQFRSILVSNANGSLGIVPEDVDEIDPQYGGIL